MGTILKLLIVVTLSVGAVGAGLLYMRTDLIYAFVRPDAPPAAMPRTRVERLPAFRDDPALNVWVTDPEPGAPVILYFMGETGVLSIHEPRLREFADAGFGIAAMAYRGGGDQPGETSEATLRRDALRVYAGLDRLMGRPVGANDRVLYGFGLGAGLAAGLGAEQEELAVILEAPFTRLCDVSNTVFSALPGCLMFRGDSYDVASVIARIDAPLMILHGALDETVPLENGQRVFEAAADPKYMRIFRSGTHENLPRYGALQEAVSFVRTLRGER